MQRFVDALDELSRTSIMLLVVVSVLGPGLPQIIFTLGLLLGIAGSRIIRSAVVSVRENMYVHAAQSIGASTGRILWRHILPNIMPPIIVLFTTRVGTVILAKSSLSFLGLGVPPPTPTWGGMLSGSGRTFMFQGPWLALAPGLCLTVVVYATNVFGDALRDLLDPRMRGSQINSKINTGREIMSYSRTSLQIAAASIAATLAFAAPALAQSRPRRRPAVRLKSEPSMSRSRRCRGIPPTGIGSTTTTPARSTNSSLSPTSPSPGGSAASIRSMLTRGCRRMPSRANSPKAGPGSRTRCASKSTCARA